MKSIESLENLRLLVSDEAANVCGQSTNFAEKIEIDHNKHFLKWRLAFSSLLLD